MYGRRCNQDRIEHSSVFELLSREVILKRVIDGASCYSHMKKFWSLKRVNKEFYAIFSSDHAKRTFKWSCSIKIIQPCWRADYMRFIHLITIQTYFMGEFVEEYCRLPWADIGKYLRQKSYGVKSFTIGEVFLIEDWFSTFAEIANQTSDKWSLRIVVRPRWDRFCQMISEKLKDMIEEKRIDLFFPDRLVEFRYGGTHDSDREKVFWGNEFILGIL
ncbi:unnamed protein product, partial [Auanema sp. JU1783]